MGSVQRHAEEERELITEKFWFTSQMVEKLALVQLGKRKIATPSHVQMKVIVLQRANVKWEALAMEDLLQT